MTSLNPASRSVSSSPESLREQQGDERAQGTDRAVDSSSMSASRRSRLRAYPHQLSGRMCQRVMIAIPSPATRSC